MSQAELKQFQHYQAKLREASLMILCWIFSSSFQSFFQIEHWDKKKKDKARHNLMQNISRWHYDQFQPCYYLSQLVKGQLISKWFLVSSNSSKKRTNGFFLLLWRLVFVCFLEEIKDIKSHFKIIWPLPRNQLS